MAKHEIPLAQTVHNFVSTPKPTYVPFQKPIRAAMLMSDTLAGEQGSRERTRTEDFHNALNDILECVVLASRTLAHVGEEAFDWNAGLEGSV